ncbi:MAG: PSD1 and planctomycete cytochrome C domain-containing protein [Planctomycetota bacterium]|nr:PSD1 and planctomycete cytochrome C domain-containing protein [Planctomycetota bacterium]
MPRHPVPSLTLLALAWCLGLTTVPVSAAAPPIDYQKQIKPLLAKHCNGCHGSTKTMSGLRTDAGQLATRGGDRGVGIVPGQPAKSLLFQALTGTDDLEQMPFDKPPLKTAEIELIKKWILQGARFPSDEKVTARRRQSDHWAFQPIVRAKLPAVSNPAWVRNAIDTFVLARLDKERLRPAPEADRVTLVRRLSLDLLGLPPSPEQVDAFRDDTRPGAYNRLVDRLLASPRYGERWGRHWLDLARYADSDGFTIDGARSIWKYRDWVIDAINANMAFDRFSTEQLAGDLIPKSRLDQLVATGFHRNTLINQEGGTDDEQFRVDAVVDRINTTGAVFMGLTVGCARCHAHKFDPISQRDFYQLFAVFNNCEDNNDANSSGPKIAVPSPEQASEQARLTSAITAAEKPLAAHDKTFAAGMPAWEKRLAALDAGSFTTLKPVKWTTAKGAVLTRLDDNSLIVDFSVPANDTYTVTLETPLDSITAVRVETLTHSSLPSKGPGRASNGNFILSEVTLAAAPIDGDAKPSPVKIASAVADHSQEGYPVAATIDGKPDTGWAINTKTGSPNVDRQAIFFPDRPISHPGGSKLVLSMAQLGKSANYLVGRFRISVSTANPADLKIPSPILAIARTPREQRSEAQAAQFIDAYRQTDVGRPPLADTVIRLKKQLDTIQKAIPTTMILRERKQPRETFIHIRGDFLRKGARVRPGVPEVLPPMKTAAADGTRLDLANWLFDPEHPLTARVTVNRFWQRFFGLGLVQTENDFGLQGETPSHPELFDWLAGEFIHRAWSVKDLHRLIVTSATYRQSSATRTELLERDPQNRLLARQTRMRMEAETIRDTALAASGLISDKIGGPGVYPPQPEGIYILTQQKKSWPEARGEDRFRRCMYTYFWRSSPYPFLPTFDAPDATTTCTRRSRSNTPLQALTLANDRAFFELAQGVAARILTEGPTADRERLRFGFRICLSREPSEAELGALGEFLSEQRQRFSLSKKDAARVAPTNRPDGIDTPEAAAWTSVGRVLVNLDEFITRE